MCNDLFILWIYQAGTNYSILGFLFIQQVRRFLFYITQYFYSYFSSSFSPLSPLFRYMSFLGTCPPRDPVDILLLNVVSLTLWISPVGLGMPQRIFNAVVSRRLPHHDVTYLGSSAYRNGFPSLLEESALVVRRGLLVIRWSGTIIPVVTLVDIYLKCFINFQHFIVFFAYTRVNDTSSVYNIKKRTCKRN